MSFTLLKNKYEVRENAMISIISNEVKDAIKYRVTYIDNKIEEISRKTNSRYMVYWSEDDFVRGDNNGNATWKSTLKYETTDSMEDVEYLQMIKCRAVVVDLYKCGEYIKDGERK